MLIFLGWSGPESKAVAGALKSWLKMVCQAFDPWYSPMIEKGDRWNAAIAEKLTASKAGVFIVTPDNSASEWLHFEAGAISNVPQAKVCAYLLRVPEARLSEPLRPFQATKAGDPEDTLRMVKTLWKQLPPEESKLTEGELEKMYALCWPELEKLLAPIKPPKDAAPSPEPPATDEMVTEMLGLVRGMDARDRERSDAERRLAAREAYARGIVAGQIRNPYEGQTIADLLRLGAVTATEASDAELNAEHDEATGWGQSALVKSLAEKFSGRAAQRRAVEELSRERPPMPPGAAPAAGKPKRPEMPSARKKG